MLKARDIVAMSINNVWELPDGPMKLEFDDGIISTTTRATIFSRYIWEIHRKYKKTPLCIRHHIGNDRLGSGTHLKLLGAAVWDCRDAYSTKGSTVNMEDLSKLAYDITNMIYNDMTVKLEEWVSSICYYDFLDVLDHPIIAQANALARPNEETVDHTIDKTYAAIKKVLLDPKELLGNGVAKAAKSGLVSMGQILQCVGPRGYATDIDSSIFKKPILSGFAHGIVSLEDSMKESRSASKALFFTKDPMAKSEYFNRNIQLSAATLSTVYQGDCGTTKFFDFKVVAGDLVDLEGMWRYDETTKKQSPIRLSDKQLIGKTIKIRTVFSCLHPEPDTVCSMCVGEIGLSVPADTNIGHLSSSELQSKVGQKILSTKHEDGSASVEPIVFDDLAKQYVKLGTDPSNVYLTENFKGMRITLTIPEEDAPSLYDLTHVDDVSILVPCRYSELKYVKFTVFKDDCLIHTGIVPVFVGTRYGVLTTDALRYIKETGWHVEDDGAYVIDVTHFDRSKVLFEIPMKYYSTIEHMKAIESFIKGKARNGVKSIVDYETMPEALAGFHDLVASKLSVNISHLQTIILSTLVEDADNRNYHLPHDRSTARPAQYARLMAMRSLAPTMAFQGQVDAIYAPESYIVTDRPKHPLDSMLMG